MNLLAPLPPAPAGAGRGAVDDRLVEGVDVQAVRAWARSRGYPIDECSGVPVTVLRTYRRLHPC